MTIIAGQPSATDQPTRPTQPSIISGSINQVPVLIGWGKGAGMSRLPGEWHACNTVL